MDCYMYHLSPNHLGSQQMEMLFCSTLVGLPLLIPPMLITGELFRAWSSCFQVLNMTPFQTPLLFSYPLCRPKKLEVTPAGCIPGQFTTGKEMHQGLPQPIPELYQKQTYRDMYRDCLSLVFFFLCSVCMSPFVEPEVSDVASVVL